MNGLLQDVQYALRQLRRAPGLTPLEVESRGRAALRVGEKVHSDDLLK